MTARGGWVRGVEGLDVLLVHVFLDLTVVGKVNGVDTLVVVVVGHLGPHSLTTFPQCEHVVSRVKFAVWCSGGVGGRVCGGVSRVVGGVSRVGGVGGGIFGGGRGGRGISGRDRVSGDAGGAGGAGGHVVCRRFFFVEGTLVAVSGEVCGRSTMLARSPFLALTFAGGVALCIHRVLAFSLARLPVVMYFWHILSLHHHVKALVATGFVL